MVECIIVMSVYFNRELRVRSEIKIVTVLFWVESDDISFTHSKNYINTDVTANDQLVMEYIYVYAEKPLLVCICHFAITHRPT